jgi:hypothetical protein
MILELKDIRAGNTTSLINYNFQMIEDFLNFHSINRERVEGHANNMLTDLVFNPGVNIYGGDGNLYVGLEEGDDAWTDPVTSLGIVSPVYEFDCTDHKDGFRMSQSILEVISTPISDLLLSQSVIEVLSTPIPDIILSQSVIEVLSTPPSEFYLSQSVIEVLHSA